MSEYWVDYRFGETHKATEFITPKTRDVENLTAGFQAVGDILTWNYQNIQYPLNLFNSPAPDAKAQYASWPFLWHKSLYRQYIWQFPTEVMRNALGICIDTANLVCTLMRAKGYVASVVLGRVLDAQTQQLLGYHAWVEWGDIWLETTIHAGQGDPADISVLKSDRQAGYKGLIYVEDSSYNDLGTSKRSEEPLRICFFGKDTEVKDAKALKKSLQKKQFRIWHPKSPSD